MYGVAKKLHLIEEILKIEDDDVLAEVECVIFKNKIPTRGSFADFAGMMSDEEVSSLVKTIEEGCETIIPMTGNKCLLDTSIIINAFKSNNNVSEKLDVMQEVYVSVTAIGELYFGADKSEYPARHLSKMQSFLSDCKILNTDTTTADFYGSIKADLARKGKPIPDNDIWIGATALQYNLPLYTADAHFKEIDGITLL